MSELINNLNEIYNVKLQLKAALETQSDVFSDYPAYVTAMKPSGYAYVTENGDHSVVGYAYVNVDVPTGGGAGDIYIATLYDGATQNLDGMNNIVYMQYGASDPVPAYGICKKVFTQEYPTAGYLKALPSELGMSADANINAYLFEPTSTASRDFSYNNVYDSGAGDISAIDSSADSISSTDLFTARVGFKYNTKQLRYNVNNTKCFTQDGINTNVNTTIATSVEPFGVEEYITGNYASEYMLFDSDLTGLSNFGSYVVVPWNEYKGNSANIHSQDQFTYNNGYLYYEPAAEYDNFPFPDIMSYVNHKIYDCVLQRTSYKGGFTTGKYDTVLVDIVNYEGDIEQAEILGMKYGSDSFNYDSTYGTYTYMMHLDANAAIQARTTYFQLTTNGSSWSNFHFCEDIAGTTPSTITMKVKTSINTSGGETTYSYMLLPSSISNYACVPTRLPSNYFKGDATNAIDVKISVDKDTWKVKYELILRDGMYMKLYDSNNDFEYIKYSSNDVTNSTYSFVYDKTKGTGLSFVFVDFNQGNIVRYGNPDAESSVDIKDFDLDNACAVNWSNVEGPNRFNYPSQSDVDDDGQINLRYDADPAAWMVIGSES